jgi:hypothetical protein
MTEDKEFYCAKCGAKVLSTSCYGCFACGNETIVKEDMVTNEKTIKYFWSDKFIKPNFGD